LQENDFQTYLYLDAAINHFNIALRCPDIGKSEKMDVHFHCAQCYIMRLQMIIDTIPPLASVTRTLIHHPSVDCMELISAIEYHLREALSRVTAANNQSNRERSARSCVACQSLSIALCIMRIQR
jgi:hypothetical protein